MKTILVTGGLGQIGSELIMKMRGIYGSEHVIATDIKINDSEAVQSGPFELVNVTDGKSLLDTAKKYRVSTIIHLASILSAAAEANPVQAWHLNMSGLLNALEVSRELRCRLFTPSSIGAFGPTSPKDHTPQNTIQRPVTMYGINKVTGELLCDYYYYKYSVDTRGLRFPGLISYSVLPGGGTTDYAVEMYIAAVTKNHYTSYIAKGTFLDMMYMPDAINAIVTLMETDSSKLKHRNAYNVTAMSLDPESLASEIKKYYPEFVLDYNIDPIRQSIADSWPNSIDATAASEEWGFKAEYDLEKMTGEMLVRLVEKYGIKANSMDTDS